MMTAIGILQKEDSLLPCSEHARSQQCGYEDLGWSQWGCENIRQNQHHPEFSASTTLKPWSSNTHSSVLTTGDPKQRPNILEGLLSPLAPELRVYTHPPPDSQKIPVPYSLPNNSKPVLTSSAINQVELYLLN